ncbi:MAG TPA: hypothetical protein VM073_07250 [Usitatibacter sp.]|nr:hypothetical protein [Usitatibacter sp.]
MERAESEEEVVSIVRDYFAMWTPEEISRLPKSCRPARLRDASNLEDLNRWGVEAFRKTRASGQELELLQKLTAIIGRACVHIARLREGDGMAAKPRPNPSKPADARRG